MIRNWKDWIDEYIVGEINHPPCQWCKYFSELDHYGDDNFNICLHEHMSTDYSCFVLTNSLCEIPDTAYKNKDVICENCGYRKDGFVIDCLRKHCVHYTKSESIDVYSCSESLLDRETGQCKNPYEIGLRSQIKEDLKLLVDKGIVRLDYKEYF